MGLLLAAPSGRWSALLRAWLLSNLHSPRCAHSQAGQAPRLFFERQYGVAQAQALAYAQVDVHGLGGLGHEVLGFVDTITAMRLRSVWRILLFVV